MFILCDTIACPSNCLACDTDAGAKCDDNKCKSTYYKKVADGLCYCKLSFLDIKLRGTALITNNVFTAFINLPNNFFYKRM